MVSYKCAANYRRSAWGQTKRVGGWAAGAGGWPGSIQLGGRQPAGWTLGIASPAGARRRPHAKHASTRPCPSLLPPAPGPQVGIYAAEGTYTSHETVVPPLPWPPVGGGGVSGSSVPAVTALSKGDSRQLGSWKTNAGQSIADIDCPPGYQRRSSWGTVDQEDTMVGLDQGLAGERGPCSALPALAQPIDGPAPLAASPWPRPAPWWTTSSRRWVRGLRPVEKRGWECAGLACASAAPPRRARRSATPWRPRARPPPDRPQIALPALRNQGSAWGCPNGAKYADGATAAYASGPWGGGRCRAEGALIRRAHDR